MDIKLPSIEEQKKVVTEKEKKNRSSYRLNPELMDKLEKAAEEKGESPSKVVQSIIENTHLDPEKFKKKRKALTLKEVHIEKLNKLSDELDGPFNRNAVLELILQEHFK